MCNGWFWLAAKTVLSVGQCCEMQGGCRPVALKMHQKVRQVQMLPSAVASPFVHQQLFAAAQQNVIELIMITAISSRLQCNPAILAFRQLTLLSCEMSTYILRPGSSKLFASSACSLRLNRRLGGCSEAASKAGCTAEACVGDINSGTILRAMLASAASATQYLLHVCKAFSA